MSNLRKILLSLVAITPISVFAGPGHVGGKVTSLLAHGQSPSIRLTGNVSPDLCDGGTYGWLGFQGTAEEQSRIYATAMAMAVTGKTVTVYTNSDGGPCKINNIQITSGLN
ncbi:MAG: hypothetical protein COB30_017720 [Ectothiorhodospiraceae bacterium]|nr:hypothetical protein [Ectothiorhodospiraceae bacterium]